MADAEPAAAPGGPRRSHRASAPAAAAEATTAPAAVEATTVPAEAAPEGRIVVNTQKYEPPASYNEVPFLAEQVAAGELPPIEERVPAEPFVVGPGVLNSEEFLDWEVGNYGEPCARPT